jgi:hypothetical protein
MPSHAVRLCGPCPVCRNARDIPEGQPSATAGFSSAGPSGTTLDLNSVASFTVREFTDDELLKVSGGFNYAKVLLADVT